MEDHRIQVRVDDAQWALANEAAALNGLRTVSGLVGLLLQREYERLGLVGTSVDRTTVRKKRRARTHKLRAAR
jgi:hypothetical protein